MRINVSQNVDYSGRVMVSCVKTWKYPENANLVSILSTVAAEFGKTPPVVQSSTTLQKSISNPLSHPSTQPYGFRDEPGIFDPTGRPAPLKQNQHTPFSNFYKNPSQSQNAINLWQDHFSTVKHLIIDELSTLAKMNEQKHNGELLIQGCSSLFSKMAKINDDQIRLDYYLENITINNEKLKRTVSDIKIYFGNRPELSESVIPLTSLDEDLLKALSIDEASQDVISILSVALERKTITPEDYLREIGTISSKQFKSRALSLKIIDYLKSV
ncbi:Tumor susceptibility protein [Thelohanellus kitauei]|uniref:Tumor susceptibility protein n=1 Tax=Thelohanellus kitauei TaxID=669202 RepID=A0A0C2MB40_THEKT|nr:Tumor susceptibility protein [Thelohanellus kitauei]